MSNYGSFQYSVESRLEMVPILPSSANSILEVGCGPGGFARTLRDRYPHAHIVGCEPSGQAESARGEPYDVVVQHAFPGDWVNGLGDIDLIIFNDVLEHLG